MTQGDGEHTQGGPLPATWIDTRVPVTSRESHRESERKVSESVALPSPSAFLPTNSRPERSKFFPQFLSPFVLPRKLATLSANDQDGARRPQSYFPVHLQLYSTHSCPEIFYPRSLYPRFLSPAAPELPGCECCEQERGFLCSSSARGTRRSLPVTAITEQASITAFPSSLHSPITSESASGLLLIEN